MPIMFKLSDSKKKKSAKNGHVNPPPIQDRGPEDEAAGEGREGGSPSRIIAVANQKGGVGKTTTAVNLSACLAYRGRDVLLIDMDPQGNATSGLGFDKQNIHRSTYNAIIHEEDINRCILATKVERLDLCPSTMHLAGAEIELASAISRETRLKEAIGNIRKEYQYILIDCPPSLGLLTINALTAAHGIMVPMQCEYYALEGLSQLMNTVRLIQRRLNKELDVEGVVMTMFDARTNLSISVVDEVKKGFPKKVYRTIIPRNVRLSEAPSFGQPIILYDLRSRGAESYLDLADEVIEKTEGSEQ